jgi:hypothetical protein
MKFPVFSLHNRELGSETSSLLTASSSGESVASLDVPRSGTQRQCDVAAANNVPDPAQPFFLDEHAQFGGIM